MKLPIWVRRHPTEADLAHANVPRSKWVADPAKVKKGLPYMKPFMDYFNNLQTNLEQGKGLLLHGPYRSGKSCLASIIVKEVAAHRCDPYWLEAFEVSDGWFHKDDRYFKSRSAHLLVVDDLGTEGQSERRDFPRESIRALFRFRLERMLPIIATTNMTPDELREKYTDKFVALMREFMTPIEVAGMDWTKVS